MAIEPMKQAASLQTPRPTTPKAISPAGPRQAWNWAVNRRGELAALLGYIFVLVVRAPWVPMMGRFWAEEATVYLSYAWTHSFLDSLTAGHLGYYNLVPTLAGILGAHVPLEWAPRITTEIALLVQLIPAALILFSSIPGLTTPLRKGMALALLLIVPANPEVLLTTVNSNLVLCAATGLILISEHGGCTDRICKWLVLGLSGLTGVASTFLAPLFWLEWWKERRRERLVQACILTGCAALQLVFASRALAGGERNLQFDPAIMAGTIYGKFIVTPLLPTRMTFDHLELIRQRLGASGMLPPWIWLLSLVVVASMLAICWRSGGRAALLLIAASLWVAAISFASSRGSGDEGKLLSHINYAIRYYYAPQFLFFLALLVSIRPGTSLPKWSQAFGGVWLCVVLVMGLFNYAAAPLDVPRLFYGPLWSQQVQKWRQDPSQPLAIWPVPWQVTLPPKP